MIWSGLGRWIGNDWKPYLESDNHEIELSQLKSEVQHKFETLWILQTECLPKSTFQGKDCVAQYGKRT